jgi:sigma-B regulation protein RsbU (phosphoserine phosphatase)
MKNQLIQNIELFASLPLEEIERLARLAQLRAYSGGEVIFTEGVRDNHFFIVRDGKVEIIKAMGTPDERRIAVRKFGDLVGEMSLFSQDGGHTASVRAYGAVELLEIPLAAFDELLQREPRMAYEIVRILSMRLENAQNLTILDLQEKNLQLTEAYQELKAAQAQIIEKEKLEHELEIARQIQQSILPEKCPELPGYDFGCLMSSARAIGGDFYDWLPMNHGQLGVIAGDVSDKGTPAALYMALTYSLLRAEARRRRAPGGALRAVNRLLLEMSVASMYVTILYGILDLRSSQFDYVRAGHTLPILLGWDGEPVETGMQVGQPLGMITNPVFDEQSLVLPRGGVLLVYSDGITEAADPQDQEFGFGRLQEALQEERNLPAQEICERLRERVIQYCGSSSQQDDLTLLCIKRLE